MPVPARPPPKRRHPETRSTSVPLLGAVVVLATVVARVVERSSSMPLRSFRSSLSRRCCLRAQSKYEGMSWICLHTLHDNKMGSRTVSLPTCCRFRASNPSPGTAHGVLDSPGNCRAIGLGIYRPSLDPTGNSHTFHARYGPQLISKPELGDCESLWRKGKEMDLLSGFCSLILGT